MSARHLHTGQRAEILARRWLKARGLQYVCANYSCRFGELDLVMQDSRCLVIVEVRYRNTQDYGGAVASVNPAKRLRIARATECFLRANPGLRRLGLRFDVLALSGSARAPKVEWRKQAFVFDDGIMGFD